MKAVGEVMSIGKTYKEAFQKSIRSLEIKRYGLGFAANFNQLSLDELMRRLNEPSSERQFLMYEALRKGATVDQLYEKTKIKRWFIQQMKELLELEEQILAYKGRELPDALLIKAKEDGFSDKYLSQILGVTEERCGREESSWARHRPGAPFRSAVPTPRTTTPRTTPLMRFLSAAGPR